MKDFGSRKTSSLFITLTLYVAVGCTHTPSQLDTTNVENISTNTIAEISPEYIVPPIDHSHIDHTLANIQKDNRNIWQHIADKLALTEFYEHPRVIQQKQKYLDTPNYLVNVTRKSEQFIHFVLSEINRRDLPAELAILPIVESNYSPKARSRAKAVGLWQFMSYTAKEFGLQKTYNYDGRYDIYASTIAALNYLEQLHAQFDENWLLALAAYNAGPHRINRALSTSSISGDENSYWNLKLPKETHEYIPKLLALSSIVGDRELSNTLLHPVADESLLEIIEVNKRILPSKLIQATGINATELHKLNPALRNINYPPPDGYRLLVPKHESQQITKNIFSIPEETQPDWEKHLVSRGESLSVIARQYGTSILAIREANNLSGNTIVSGHTLLIPPYKRNTNKPPPQLPQHKKTPTQTSEHDVPYFYVVAMGDSFWAIASRNNTTVERLAKINDRNPNQPLQPGESILID